VSREREREIVIRVSVVCGGERGRVGDSGVRCSQRQRDKRCMCVESEEERETVGWGVHKGRERCV